MSASIFNKANQPRLLLLSNSTMSGTSYMEWSKDLIFDFLDPCSSKIDEILFIPFAGVLIDWSKYTKKVREALFGFKVKSIHETPDYIEAIKQARCIMIGGGNTFYLLYKLYKYNLLDAIRERVLGPDRIPYIGWSAGSNVAGPDIGTTNDMPIIWPSTDKALGLVPYNINPHYNEWTPPNLKAETRVDRLNECVVVKKRPIVAIAEGIALKVENGVHRIVAPTLKSLTESEGGDQRCVKVWTNSEDGTPNHVAIDINTPLCEQIEKLLL